MEQDWNFKFVNGGFDTTPPKNIKHRYFQPIEIKLSYCLRFVVEPNILGLNAVHLVRRHPSVTDMVSFHQYLSAN